MRGRIWSYAFLLAAVVLLAAAQVSAQTISGIIAGRVVDAQGKPESTVAIIAQNHDTGRSFQASSDSQGYFRILEVTPGLYEVRALQGGFPTVKHMNVRVDVNRTTEEDIVLLTDEKPALPSTAPMTDLYSPTLSMSFPEGPVVEIPVITRDVNNLALLSPGVQSVRTFSFASTLVPFSVNGSRGRDNNFVVDSVDNNEPLFGGAASQFTNSEIFQEYTILTGQMKAEFGRNTGATVNAITKSGSNLWHGTLFGYGQGDAFDAMNRVEKQALLTSPEPFYDTTFGTTLGGPVRKDKSFFFLSYQWDRLSDNLTDVFPVLSNYPATPADLAILQSLPTSSTLQAYLATPSVTRIPTQTGTPCFNGPPPQPAPPLPALYSSANPCLLTPTAVPVSGAFIGQTAETANFNVWNVPNANTFNLRDHQLSGRFDQKINDSNDFYTRYLFDDLASPRSPLETAGVGAFSDIGLLPDWRTDLRQRTQSFLVDHRYRRPGGSLNEFRMSYSRVSQQQGAFGAPADTLNRPSAIIEDTYAQPSRIGGLGGQQSLPVGGVIIPPGVFPSAGDLITLGQDGSPSRISSNTYQVQDNYSYTVGRHSIKLGANFAKIDSNILGMPDDNGFYLYSGFPGLNGFQAFLNEGAFGPTTSSANVASQRLVDVRTDASGNVIGQGPNELKIKGFDQFYFAQDDWRFRNNLSISIGIRYENYGQPINSVHNINSSAPFVNTDNKDFAPRLGIAWAPSQHWVIRGGYNIQYNPPILNLPLLLWESGPVSPLLSTDIFGVAQLQPQRIFPQAPLAISDLQRTLPAGTVLAGTGAPIPTAISTGRVQGCSQYFDLYDTLAQASGFPSVTPFPSRAYNGPVQGTGAVNIPIVNCAAQDTVDKNLKNPYVQIWSLGVQHELGANFLAEVDYVGSKGTRLFQRVEKNPFQGWNSDCLQNISTLFSANGDASLAVPGQCRLNRIDDSHGDITSVTNGGSSTYHSLQATLTKRFSHVKHFGDVTFTNAYTWSHLIDNTSELFGPGFRTLGPGDIQTGTSSAFPIGILFDPLANAPVEAVTPLAQTYNSTTGGERGNSSFDRRNHFASSFLWEPFSSKGRVLGGWQLGGVFTYQSGQPFSPLNASPFSACADSNGDGSVSNDRPDIGNPKAPISSVALINPATDPQCLPASVLGHPLDYVDLNGKPILPANAHFVQRPLFSFAPTNAQTLPGLTLGTNPNVIAAALNGQQYSGTAGRNSLVGPSTTNLDFSVYKTIAISERFKLQLRAESYDLLNHANPGYFNGSPYIGGASAAPAFAYAATRTGAAITGGIPESAIDAVDTSCAAPPTTTVCTSTGRMTNRTFLSSSTLNTGSRRLQFGLRLIF